MFSSATQPPRRGPPPPRRDPPPPRRGPPPPRRGPPPPRRGPPPPRHNFVVSAITFEGFKGFKEGFTFFKLDTYIILIRISRTRSIIDIVVPSKMAAGGHFVKKKFKKSCVSI